MVTQKKAYSVLEARELIGGLSQASFYKLVNSGQLKTIKIGGRRLIPAESIDELIQRALESAGHVEAA